MVTLFLGFGLLFLKPWARTYTILFAVLIAGIVIFGALDAVFGFDVVYLNRGRQRVYVSERPGLSLSFCALGMVAAIWSIRLLLRNDVSLLFGDRFHLQPLEKRPRIDEARAETDPV